MKTSWIAINTEINTTESGADLRMNLLCKLFCLALTVATFTACKKSENLDRPAPVGLGGETWVKGPIDYWLLDSLTTPYNIAVKYRWDPWELQVDRTLTPPDESKIITAMSAIKRVWIDPYNQETGSELFIKKYSPKQFVLVGSVQYDFGTVLLGQAEGGNNIVFLDINQNFDRDGIKSIRRMIQTSHHEFGHILHQNIRYPQEYKTITSDLGLEGYTSAWFNVSDKEALDNGYVTPYSMATYDEDFVEMIANMLMQGRVRFNEIVASTNPTAQKALRQKEQIIVDYFSPAYKIDFYSLQTRVQAALNQLITVPAITENFGFDKDNSIANIDPTNTTLTPSSSAFISLFNTSAANVAALGFGLTLDSLAIRSIDETSSVIRMYIKQNGTVFAADFTYNFTVDGNDVYDFTYVSANATGATIQTAVAPLLDYFSNNQFKATWYANPSATIYPRIKFSPQSSPSSYFIANLLP